MDRMTEEELGSMLATLREHTPNWSDRLGDEIRASWQEVKELKENQKKSLSTIRDIISEHEI